MPNGYQLVEGQCVLLPVLLDVCPNIEGAQGTVPTGLQLLNSECVIILPSVASLDLCPNLGGAQTTVPAGYAKNNTGACELVAVAGAVQPPASQDVCTNLSGIQTLIPNGMIRGKALQCIGKPVRGATDNPTDSPIKNPPVAVAGVNQGPKGDLPYTGANINLLLILSGIFLLSGVGCYIRPRGMKP